jgi:hypothetical protein
MEEYCECCSKEEYHDCCSLEVDEGGIPTCPCCLETLKAMIDGES